MQLTRDTCKRLNVAHIRQKCSAQAELALSSALRWQDRVTKLQDGNISLIHSRRQSGNKEFYFKKSVSCSGFCVSVNVDGFTSTSRSFAIHRELCCRLARQQRRCVKVRLTSSHTDVCILRAAERSDCAKAATITASIPSGANKSR